METGDYFPDPFSFSLGFSANFNKLKALALEFGVHGQWCAQFDQDKKSVSVQKLQMVKIEANFWLLRDGTRLPFTAQQCSGVPGWIQVRQMTVHS